MKHLRYGSDGSSEGIAPVPCLHAGEGLGQELPCPRDPGLDLGDPRGPEVVDVLVDLGHHVRHQVVQDQAPQTQGQGLRGMRVVLHELGGRTDECIEFHWPL